jgi:dTDP-4-dehydrorhamnose reductase
MYRMFLIVGGDSEIGGAAFAALKAENQPVAATTRRRDRVAQDQALFDLAASLEGWEPPQGATSACVCAAVARLADCAADPRATAYINVTQTLALVDKLLKRGIYVLFLSTNQVFDGSIPRVPPDAPHSPVSEYGRQKACTESALQDYMARGASVGILRLAKVVSPRMALLQRWIAELSNGTPISAFTDMTLAPTQMASVTSAISALLGERAAAVFQLTGPRDVSYADVGRFLAGKLGVEESLVQGSSARAAGLPEGATPLHTTLDSSVLRDRFGLEVPDVWQVIESVTSSGVGQRRAMQNAG